jgi:hypothetical protein
MFNKRLKLNFTVFKYFFKIKIDILLQIIDIFSRILNQIDLY